MFGFVSWAFIKIPPAIFVVIIASLLLAEIHQSIQYDELYVKDTSVSQFLKNDFFGFVEFTWYQLAWIDAEAGRYFLLARF